MKHLLEIATVLTRKKIRKIELIDGNVMNKKANKFNEFYQGLVDREFESDKEAAKVLYDATPLDDRYRQLKSRFKKRFYSTLFFVDANGSNVESYSRAYFTCTRDWSLVQLLSYLRIYKTATHMAENVYKIADKFQFSDMLYNSSKFLRFIAAKNEDKVNFERYDLACKKHGALMLEEGAAEAIYDRVLLALSTENVEASIAKINALYDEIQLFYQKDESNPVFWFVYNVTNAIKHELNNSLDSALEAFNRIETHMLANTKLFSSDRTLDLLKRKLQLLIKLKDIDSAVKCMEWGAPMYGETRHWLDLQELYIQAAFSVKNFDLARDILDSVLDSKNYANLDEHASCRWMLYHGLVFFDLYRNAGDKKPTRYRTFKVKKFLYEPMSFPKSFRLEAVFVHLLQLILFFEMDKISYGVERLERLNYYWEPLCRGEQNIRLKYFVKYMDKVVKLDFDGDMIAINKVADKHLSRFTEDGARFMIGKEFYELLPLDYILEIVNEKVEFTAEAVDKIG